jgi:hypothetical protein
MVEEAKRRVMGVHISAGKAYLGLIECPDTIEMGGTDVLSVAEHLDPAEKLADFRAQFEQELRTTAPARVGVMNTRRYAGWEYYKAFSRISMESAVMIASANVGVPFESVKQETTIKMSGLPSGQLVSGAAELLGIDHVPRYWKDRALAFLAAWVIGKEAC